MMGLLLEPIANASSGSALQKVNELLTSIRDARRTSTFMSAEDDQSWFLSEEWQAGEREVDDHVARGEVRAFDGSTTFLAHLRGLIDEG